MIRQVAAGRILNCLNADALITIVAPSSGLNSEVIHRIRTCPTTVKHIDRTFVVSDLDTSPPPSLVLCAIDDPVASTEVYQECHKRRIPANIADVPPECDFYFGSTHRDGSLQIMVSTNGQGPRMAALVRKWIGSHLPKSTGKAVDSVGVLRRKLRSVAPDAADGPKRMKWLVCT
jgi:precorrin-2 dehydrogenase / sirohydrochlorin ferrochelatase